MKPANKIMLSYLLGTNSTFSGYLPKKLFARSFVEKICWYWIWGCTKRNCFQEIQLLLTWKLDRILYNISATLIPYQVKLFFTNMSLLKNKKIKTIIFFDFFKARKEKKRKFSSKFGRLWSTFCYKILSFWSLRLRFQAPKISPLLNFTVIKN